MRISDWSSDVCSSDLRFLAGAGEDVLIFARAPADDVGDAGEQVAEDVGADDDLAGDDAQIFADRAALDGVGGGAEHDGPSSYGWVGPHIARNAPETLCADVRFRRRLDRRKAQFDLALAHLDRVRIGDEFGRAHV